MSAPVLLMCLVYDQPFARVFDVEIERGKPVSALKQLIKAVKQNEFDRIDANILDLYQVEIPITDDEIPQNPDLSNNTKLQAGMEIGTIFQVAPRRGVVHIIIKVSVATPENPPRTATKRMREEGQDILNRTWSKKPDMEISVSKSFADRKEAARFAYGVQSYAQILLEDLFFVSHLKLFRNPPSHCLFLCRPKRHGKTLLCSLAQSFYDIMNKLHFERMFPDVDAKDFTPHPSSFMVLSLSFEGLQPSDLASSECGPEFERNFQYNLTRYLLGFYQKYELDIPTPLPQDALDFFQDLVQLLEHLNIPMMIIVDEYDSSVNSALISPNADCFRKYLKARTCGYFRFFTLLKQALRVVHNHALVVGVTPLALSDSTSGFNIRFDMTWDSGFQDVCGITIDDIEPVLNNIGQKYRWDVKTKEQFNKKLIEFYDGYHFGGDMRIFNAGQVVNCLQHIYRHGEFPNPLVDVNTNLSESVLEFISQCTNKQFYPILMELLTDKVEFRLSAYLSIDTVRNELNAGNTNTLLSLMVYYGALTVVTTGGRTYAKIPNNVAREVFVTLLLENLQLTLDSESKEHLFTAVKEFLSEFNPTPLINLLHGSLLPIEEYSDVVHSLESTFKIHFQVLILAGLPINERSRLTNEFCFPQGQADTVVFPSNYKNDQHPLILIEFKNTPIRDLASTPKKWEDQIKLSQKFIAYDDDQMNQLELRPSGYHNFKTVSARLDDAMRQLQVNAQKLQSGFPGREIIGFVMYRVGLHRVMYKRVEFPAS